VCCGLARTLLCNDNDDGVKDVKDDISNKDASATAAAVVVAAEVSDVAYVVICVLLQ